MNIVVRMCGGNGWLSESTAGSLYSAATAEPSIWLSSFAVAGSYKYASHI